MLATSGAVNKKGDQIFRLSVTAFLNKKVHFFKLMPMLHVSIRLGRFCNTCTIFIVFRPKMTFF